jgi:hypothetical protein
MRSRSDIIPDDAALAFAHKKLRTNMSIKDMLAHPSFSKVLLNAARRHMQRRDQFDVKKLQANDNDE